VAEYIVPPEHGSFTINTQLVIDDEDLYGFPGVKRGG